MKKLFVRLISFRALAYLVAILCWLGMVYVAAQRANTIDDSMMMLVGTFSLGALTLLVVDSIRRTPRR
jgi:hypothetical protein